MSTIPYKTFENLDLQNPVDQKTVLDLFKVTGSFALHFKECKKVAKFISEKIKLGNCVGLQIEACENVEKLQLSHLQHLQEFKLMACQGVKEISVSTDKLYMENVSLVTPFVIYETQMPDNAKKNVIQLGKTKNIEFVQIANTDPLWFDNCEQVQSLSIQSNQSNINITKCNSLQTINIDNQKTSTEELILTKCNKLKELNLVGSFMLDVYECPNLRETIPDHVSLRKIYTDDTIFFRPHHVKATDWVLTEFNQDLCDCLTSSEHKTLHINQKTSESWVRQMRHMKYKKLHISDATLDLSLLQHFSVEKITVQTAATVTQSVPFQFKISDTLATWNEKFKSFTYY